MGFLFCGNKVPMSCGECGKGYRTAACVTSNNVVEDIKGGCQKLLSRFCPLRGGGTPPFPLSFFEHNNCPLRGGGVPPNSAKENSAKVQVF